MEADWLGGKGALDSKPGVVKDSPTTISSSENRSGHGSLNRTELLQRAWARIRKEALVAVVVLRMAAFLRRGEAQVPERR